MRCATMVWAALRVWQTVGTLGRARGIQADNSPFAEPTPQHSEDPEARLWSLLTTWAGMNEAEWEQDSVDRLKDEILDVFKARPDEAERWYREWRAAHREGRLV